MKRTNPKCKSNKTIQMKTITEKEYKELKIISRKYTLIIAALVDGTMDYEDKIWRMDDITEDTYKFNKGE